MQVFICVLTLLALSYGEKKSFAGDKVYRLSSKSIEESNYIQSLIDNLQLDLWKKPKHARDTADVRVPLLQQSRFNVLLETHKINFEILIEDLQLLIDKEELDKKSRDAPDIRTTYLNFDEIMNWMDEFASMYSRYVEIIEGGTSYENRKIHALKITKATTGEGRTIFLNCGTHSMQWISPAVCLNIANFIVEDQTNDFDDLTFVIVPSSNPDGYVYTWTKERLWRKNRKPHHESACIGVDSNSNWNNDFEGEFSNTDPCSDTYRGPYAMSENIVQIQDELVDSLDNVVMYFDIYAYGQYWMYPYSKTRRDSPDENLLNEISQRAASAIYQVDGKIFETGSIADVFYVASGNAVDYFYENKGIKCTFALELRDTGKHGFILPADQILDASLETYAGIKSSAADVKQGLCD